MDSYMIAPENLKGNLEQSFHSINLDTSYHTKNNVDVSGNC